MKFSVTSTLALLLATGAVAVEKECTTKSYYKAIHTYKPLPTPTLTTTYKPKPKPKPTHSKKPVVYTTKAYVAPKPTSTYVAPKPVETKQPSYGGGGGGSSGLSGDQQKALDVHNAGRAEHGCGDLVWDSALQASAQEWANQLTQIGHLQHSQGGQNLYWSSGSNSSPLADGTHAWMNEESLYHGESIPNGNFASYGHYTQCVWKGTKKVGVASAKDSKGGVYVVAHYSPAGNMVGQTPF